MINSKIQIIFSIKIHPFYDRIYWQAKTSYYNASMQYVTTFSNLGSQLINNNVKCLSLSIVVSLILKYIINILI